VVLTSNIFFQLIGQANALFRAAIETGKVSLKESLNVIYAVAASAAKKVSDSCGFTWRTTESSAALLSEGTYLIVHSISRLTTP